MLTFFRRLFGPPPAPSPRLVTVVNRVDDLEARLEYLSDELKALRGRVTGKERKARQPVEDEPPAGGDGQPEEPAYSRPAPPSTAYLARRFKRF
jgi:hypothetical protein